MRYNEDELVQKTTADYFETLGWTSVVAYHSETLGPDGLLGRASDKEMVLTRELRLALIKLNPGLPESAYDDAIRQVVARSSTQSPIDQNQAKYQQILDGVKVTIRNSQGEREEPTLKLIDFENSDHNSFLVVRELWVKGDLYRRRLDLVGFVNGLPLLFVECKNIHKDLRRAYDGNLSDYKSTVPHIFDHNAVVMLANGLTAKIGSITSKFEHFHDWKRLEEDDPGIVDMETLLKGICSKSNFLDLVENFILFDQSSGAKFKILGKNHQLLGVNRAIKSLVNRESQGGKLGVFWHTQGSGKSYSMVFFTRKVHRKLGSNFTFLICTDREDLDRQIYNTFAGCGVVNNDRDPCRASGGAGLKALLGQQKTHIFTLVQKFHENVSVDGAWTERRDIIVISDEAHRSQYGTLSLNMRNALPGASYIGFTGTPLFGDDELTKQVFGDYVSTYDFQRAVADGATVPLFYDSRGLKLGIATTDLNERISQVLDQLELDDVDVQQRLEGELRRDYHIITAEKRLRAVAEDFVWHYSTGWESGKAMLVCIDKLTCVRLHAMIIDAWNRRIAELEKKSFDDEQEAIQRDNQVKWMRDTICAVVVSEEQGEVDRFAKWDLDIRPHRKLIREGFESAGERRVDMETAFKSEQHPFRIAIVCAMWLTGFDVPSLSNLYIDKPLKAHTLMQAIARANRVNAGKNNGLIVDYCGFSKYLREALATFAGTGDSGRGGQKEGVDPLNPDDSLVEQLKESIEYSKAFLVQLGVSLDTIGEHQGFERIAAIAKIKEAVNTSDETRKKFELSCREVFRKFKACLTNPKVNALRADKEALSVVYQLLQDDRLAVDLSEILRPLTEVINQAIVVTDNQIRSPEHPPYDISNINFELLRKEFEKSPKRNTMVQEMKVAIEKRLASMLAKNPLRTDFQEHYEAIIAGYNSEQDHGVIQATFEKLYQFVQTLDAEESRSIREKLDDEYLAVFDILHKPQLEKKDFEQIKKVATGLLTKLKEERLRTDRWYESDQVKDAVWVDIRDYLWDEHTGLPSPAFTEQEVTDKANLVFAHMLYAYPYLPSPVYAA